ncbi:MAG: peptidoglycan DD-metalloendopeptidase family protein, partial [Patescibacteria group bacterium]
MKPSSASEMPRRSSGRAALTFTALTLCAALLGTSALAETADELQGKIDGKTAELKELQDEILKYEQELDTVTSARKTLETEVKRLDISRKKISTDIAVTQNRITTAELKIDELGNQIGDKEKRIESGRAVIEVSLRMIGRLDEVTVAEHFLSGNSFTEGWEEADRLREVHGALGEEIVRLLSTKEELTDDRDAVEEEQDELLSFKSQLSGQKSVLDANRKNQVGVLSDTKNKESNYQKILEEKKAAALQLQDEISGYESNLKFSLDPSSIPSPGSGVLSFPLDPTFMARCTERQKTFKNLYCITQYFGNTSFARSGAYSGKNHNGVDFGSPEGTKVVSALAGVVTATGNTDTIRGCYSYGRWILVEHGNGLSSLYAHLSYTGVSAGQAVGRGDFIGYSGETGYATGPHLHFTLFAT